MEEAAICDKTRQCEATASLDPHLGNANLTLIDCHAHIYPPEFSFREIDSLLERAAANGVTRIVNVPESLTNAHTILSLSQTCSQSRCYDKCEDEANEGIRAISDVMSAGHGNDADVDAADTAGCDSRRVTHRCGGAASCAARMLCPSVGLHPVQSRCSAETPGRLHSMFKSQTANPLAKMGEPHLTTPSCGLSIFESRYLLVQQCFLFAAPPLSVACVP